MRPSAGSPRRSIGGVSGVAPRPAARDGSRRAAGVLAVTVLAMASGMAIPTAAQEVPADPAPAPAVPTPAPAAPTQVPQPSADYVVGPQDTLVITSYDQPELTGRFTIETDGSFTYPLIGRVQVGGMTLRGVEATLEAALVDQGFFVDPEVSVAIEQYRSQRVYIVGEVRTPGAYPMSGEMRLVEALALAGSTLPTASGEAVIVHQSDRSLVVDEAGDGNPSGQGNQGATRVDLQELENGDLSQNVLLSNNDTVFVLRAESIYVFGQVRNPGAYPLRQQDTTVLQALSLAGGVTDRGATGRIRIVRIVDGERQEIRAELTDFVQPRDTIVVPERFF